MRNTEQRELWEREWHGCSSPRSLRSLGSERAVGQARVGRKGPTVKMQTGSGALGYINLAHTPTPQQPRRHRAADRRRHSDAHRPRARNLHVFRLSAVCQTLSTCTVYCVVQYMYMCCVHVQ